MPITKSAKKALRQAGGKKSVNDFRKKVMKEKVKQVEKLVKAKEGTKEALSSAYSAIDKAYKTGVIKKNTASRKKARLSKITKAK